MRRLAVLLILLVSIVACLFGARPDGSVGLPGLRFQNQTLLEQSLAIVVNRSNSVENLSMAELRRVFLGERGHWPNGRRIILVMMEPDEPERKAVLREIYQMSEKQVNKHFLHGLFTGEVLVSPKTLSTPAGVRKFIFNVPGAIGYLRFTDVNSSVKALRIDERLPDEKLYRLHIPPRQDK